MSGVYDVDFPQLLSYAAQDKKYLLIGISAHHKLDFLMKALSPASIQAMAKEGVKSIGLEIPQAFQKDVNDYYQDKISHYTLAKHYANNLQMGSLSSDESRIFFTRLADVLKEAKAAGITVEYLDTPAPISTQQPEMRDHVHKIIALREKGGMEAVNKYTAALEAKTPGTIAKLNAYLETSNAQRRAVNPEIAQRVEALGTKGKVALIMGDEHFAAQQGINAYLGKNATVITMEESYGPQSNGGRSDDALPDYVHFTKFKLPGGSEVPASAKVQPSDQRSEACKIAVNKVKGLHLLIGCTVEDAAFETYARTLPKAKSETVAALRQ